MAIPLLRSALSIDIAAELPTETPSFLIVILATRCLDDTIPEELEPVPESIAGSKLFAGPPGMVLVRDERLGMGHKTENPAMLLSDARDHSGRSVWILADITNCNKVLGFYSVENFIASGNKSSLSVPDRDLHRGKIAGPNTGRFVVKRDFHP